MNARVQVCVQKGFYTRNFTSGAGGVTTASEECQQEARCVQAYRTKKLIKFNFKRAHAGRPTRGARKAKLINAPEIYPVRQRRKHLRSGATPRQLVTAYLDFLIKSSVLPTSNRGSGLDLVRDVQR